MKTMISDRAFGALNTGLLLLFSGMILFPLLFVLSASMSDPMLVNMGKVWI
jgi:putative aldouronate transport system permease protein